MSFQHPLVIKHVRLLWWGWEVQVHHSYPLRHLLSASNFTFDPARKCWWKHVGNEQLPALLEWLLRLTAEWNIRPAADVDMGTWEQEVPVRLARLPWEAVAPADWQTPGFLTRIGDLNLRDVVNRHVLISFFKKVVASVEASERERLMDFLDFDQTVIEQSSEQSVRGLLSLYEKTCEKTWRGWADERQLFEKIVLSEGFELSAAGDDGDLFFAELEALGLVEPSSLEPLPCPPTRWLTYLLKVV